MSGWMIFALVVVVFFLIGQIRVGVDARFGEDGPLVKIRLGLIRFKVFPLPVRNTNKKDAKKKQRGKSEKNPEPVRDKAITVSSEGSSAAEGPASRHQEQTQEPPKKTSTRKQDSAKKSSASHDKKAGKKMSPDQILALAQEFVPLALEAVSKFWSDLVTDELEIAVTVGDSDPADAAMLYGKINAAMGAVWQPLSEALHVKNGRAHVGIDFESQSITLYAHAALSIKIDQILRLASYFGVKALRKFMKVKKQQKAKEQSRKAV